jgi:hypothetical protein
MGSGENRMLEPSSPSPVSTFVVRFWREWSAKAGRWRGRIEHVQSGRRADFVEPEAILAFVQALGVMADEGAPPRPADTNH